MKTGCLSGKSHFRSKTARDENSRDPCRVACPLAIESKDLPNDPARPGVHVASSVDVVEGIAAMWDELRRLVTP
jgi:hypothetical protein